MPVEAPDKIVIVVDGDLPAGLAMNAAAALALSVGRMVEGILGGDVKDADGFVHPGITKVPVPVLRGSAEGLHDIMIKAVTMPGLFVVDFTDTAQRARSYDEYTVNLAAIPTGELLYIGVALAGSKKDVNRLAGSLPLYR